MAVVEEVRTLFQGMIKAVKSLQMYGSDHPMVAEIHNSLFAGLEDYLLRFGDFVIEVRQFEIFCDEEEIYRDEDRTTSIPFRLFSDGIRSIGLHPGISSEEFKRFLGLLIKEVKPGEEDLTTLLWESDFGHITYDIVQPGVDVPEDIEQVDYLSERKEEKIPAAYPIEENELRQIEIPISEVAVSDEEISKIKSEIDNIESAVYRDFIISFERAPIVNEQSYIIFFDGFPDMSKQLLTLGDIESIARLIRIGSHQNMVSKEPLKIRFEKFIDFINSEDFLKPFFNFIVTNWQAIDQSIAKEILNIQDARSLPILFSLYRDIKVYEFEYFLANRIVSYGEETLNFFKKIVDSGDEDGVLSTIEIIAAANLKNSTEYLSELFSFPSSEVKMKAIEILIAIGEGDVTSNMSRLINDPNESVRIATVKAIAQFKAEKFADYLAEIIKGDDFKDRTYEEKNAFIFAYCDLVKDGAIDYLGKMLNRWSPIKSSHGEEMRNLAALGLGRIGSAASLAVILKGSKSHRKSIKDASVRGLKLFEKRGRDDRERTKEKR